MFLPALNPAELQGQSLKLKANYLGVGVVVVAGVPSAGPLFRAGNTVHMLRAENREDGSCLFFQDIGDRAALEVQEYRETIAGLAERVEFDRKVISDLREQVERGQTALALFREVLEQSNANEKTLEARIAEIRRNAESTSIALQRYVDAVGELDAEPVPADTPAFDFSAEPPPYPVQGGGGEPYPNEGRGITGNTISKTWGEHNPMPFDSDLL